MTVPSGPQRYIAGSWIAAGTSVVLVVLGTVMVLSVRDRLPDRIPLHWHDGQPDLSARLTTVVVVTAALSWGLTALVLLAGRWLAGSWRHTWSSAAIAFAVGPPVVLLGTVWQQRNGPVDLPPPSLHMFGFTWAALSSSLMASWTRPRFKASPVAPIADTPPPATRRAWVGQARMSWPVRIATALTAVVFVVFVAWWIDDWALVLFVGGVCVVALTFDGRLGAVVVDYSGVGMRRGFRRPSPIKLHEISGVSVRRVDVLREFGGWGQRRSVDGTEGWATRSGEALVVHRFGRPDFVFTVDDARGAADVLTGFLARSEVA